MPCQKQHIRLDVESKTVAGNAFGINFHTDGGDFSGRRVRSLWRQPDTGQTGAALGQKAKGSQGFNEDVLQVA